MSDGESGYEAHFCHIVIPSKDFRASKVFFEDVFRWEVQPATEGNSLGVLPRSKKRPSAELNSEEETIVPAIFTPDIESILRPIEEHGGKKLTGKTPVGQNAEHGYYALLEDPQGNRMCLCSDR